MIRKRTLLSLESLEERTVLSTSPLQTSCGVGVDPYQSLWSSDAEILDGPILTTEDFSVGQSGSSPNNENQIQIITDLGDEVLPIPLNQNDLFTENNENLCQLECVDSDGNPIPLPNPGGPIQPPIPVPPGGWDVGLLPNEPVPFPFPGPIPPLPSPGEFDALLPSPRGGFPQPLPLPLPPFPQPLPLPSDGFGLLPPLPGESLPLPPLPFPPNPLPLPFPLPSDGLDQLPFPGDFDPIPLPGPIPPWGGDLPLPREVNPLPFPLPLPLPPGGFDLPPVPLPLPLPGGFNPWQQFPPGFNPGGQGPNDGNLDFSPGRDNRTNDPKPNGEPQEDNRNGLFFGYSEEDKAGGYTFGFGAYRHEGKDGDIIGILTGDFDFGLFGEDGSRRRGFRANVQVLEVDSGRIDLGNNGFIQIDGKGPEANAAANGGQDGAELGVGASLIGTSVTLGTSDPNSDSDVQSRVGINVGVGAGGRLHWSDEDGDGFREFGVGVDVIFVSVDVKSEDPLKTLLVGPLGTYILSDDGNWTYGALDSATEFGEDAGEYIHDISQGTSIYIGEGVDATQDAIDRTQEGANRALDRGQQAVDDLQNGANQVIDQGQDAVDNAQDSANQAFDRGQNAIDQGQNNANSFVDSAQSALGGGTAVDTAIDTAQGIANGVVDTAQQGAELAQDLANGALDTAQQGAELAQDLANSALDTAQQGAEVAKDLANGALDTAQQGLNLAGRGAQGVVNFVGGFFRSE